MMDSYDLQVRQGETLPLTFEVDETGADTLTITISQEDVVVLTKSADFDGLSATITLDDTETDLAAGLYDYMFTVVYDDGTVEKYPDVSGCSDCDLPILEVCEANDELLSS